MMTHLMELHSQLKIQVVMFLKQLLPMDRKQNLKNIQVFTFAMTIAAKREHITSVIELAAERRSRLKNLWGRPLLE